ncbi:MAG: hypothetical protein AAB397_01680 [Patescibacteria group bacterium]
MNKKHFFIVVATVSLLVQIISPMWWKIVVVSFWTFFIEGILEGGFFKEVVIGADQAGNSILYGSFLIYSIIALIVSIWSFFSAKGMDSGQVYTKKKNVVFLMINILTITFTALNGAFFPRMGTI